MNLKCLEVRDRATFIPVVAMDTRAANAQQQVLLRSQGYSVDGRTVIVVQLNDGTGQCDAYAWGSRTMTAAHVYIEAHFGELKDGDVVDVEFILGESAAPKVSEVQPV